MLSLPLPLLLLIHIHLLGYPRADEPEYDEHVFNVKLRGLRDRIKTMEDLCYFLVGKIEPKPRLKSLFPTYPCSQPSDSVAFRAVLAKYLEGLRNQAIRPETLPKLQSTSSKGKSPAPDPGGGKMSSYGDLCSRNVLGIGEHSGSNTDRFLLYMSVHGVACRFERMIVALSTHALFSNTAELLNISASDISAALSLLPTLPRAHVSLEATIRDARCAWERSAALVQQRQADSKHSESDATAGTVHENLATHSLGELVTICESKREQLQHESWRGEDGRECLNFVVGLAGLKWTNPPTDQIERTKVPSTIEELLPPLPTAAAHHPQHTESFLSPVISTSSVPGVDLRLLTQTSDCDLTCESATPRVNSLIAERLAAEEQTKLVLREALNRMHTMHEGLQAQLQLIPESASARAQSGNPPPAPSEDVTTEVQTREKAARPPAQNQAVRIGRGGTGRSGAFPLPKASQTRKPPSLPRIPSVTAVGPAQPIRRSKPDPAKNRSKKRERFTKPAASCPQPSGADNHEEELKLSPAYHQSAGAVTTTTTTPIIDFEDDEAYLPSDLKPYTKPPATPKLDFIEDNSAFLPAFLKRDMIQTGPARQLPAPASSRESTPERGTATPSEGDGKDDDDWGYEGKSMTLRDILVRAGDATFAHFDILRERYLSFSHLFIALKAAHIRGGGKNVHVSWLNCVLASSATPRWQGC
ncbi:hypothetical protein EI94DRAFT_924825 [Lactarius quietus]|nr:hypothetical protein EI94DRAFT_924825 [Lactarius quietus]